MRRLLFAYVGIAGCDGTFWRGYVPDEKSTASSWAPGDPIPGWEDFDCDGPYPDGGHLAVDAMNVELVEAYIGGKTSQDGEFVVVGRHFSLVLADCGELDCGPFDTWDLATTPYGAFVLGDNEGDLSARGQGWYGPEAGAANYGLTANVNLPYGAFVNDLGHYDNMAGLGCLSRVRPDMISGFVTFTIEDARYGEPSVYYRPVLIVLPFSVTFADHAAYDPNWPTDGLEPPPTAELRGYRLFDYAQSWPWDEITDPAIRDVVYERYKPWNMP